MGLTRDILLEKLCFNESTGIFTNKKGKLVGTNDRGYIKIYIFGRQYMAHRLVWLYYYGFIPKKKIQIDHINQNRSDNRIANLRLVTIQENQKNRKISQNNKSGCMGVYKVNRKHKHKWASQIWVNNKGVHVGIFDTYEEAVEARANAEKDYGFHTNHNKNK